MVCAWVISEGGPKGGIWVLSDQGDGGARKLGSFFIRTKEMGWGFGVSSGCFLMIGSPVRVRVGTGLAGEKELDRSRQEAGRSGMPWIVQGGSVGGNQDIPSYKSSVK